ncbi:hypothetical protein ACJ2CR_22965 [Myxococcus faecalis]|uniref:hypothetical protein n=1 Tax=Myxococcus faecalis TaxID=3115646 RepID=UPI0038D184D8
MRALLLLAVLLASVAQAQTARPSSLIPNFDDARDKAPERSCDKDWSGRVTWGLCTLSRQPDALWFLEKNDALIRASSKACGQNQSIKSLTLSSCGKPDATIVDASPCVAQLTTCLHELGKGLIAVEHYDVGNGTSYVRVYDVPNRKRLTSEEWRNGCTSSACSVGALQDVDGDGLPEIVFRQSREPTARPERILKWKGSSFQDVGRFLWKGQPTQAR